MNAVLLDSNLLIALIDERDSLHAQTKKAYSQVSPSLEQIIPDVVSNEALTAFARRSEELRQNTFASLSKRFQDSYPREKFVWLSPEVPRLYSQIVEMMTAHDGKLNFHDCLLALWMKENGIEYILTFDADLDLVPYLKRIPS